MKDHEGPVWAERNGLRIIHCWTCGFCHLDPLPTVAWATDYYATSRFYKDFAPMSWFSKETLEHRQGLWEPSYLHQTRLMGCMPFLVDVGCGAGWYVYHWNRRRSLAFGIEPSLSARLASPVPQFLFKNWNEVDAAFRERAGLSPSGQEGHLHASLRAALVLEHLPDPRGFLAECHEHLHREGRLLVIMPNEFNPLQKRINRGAHKDWFVAEPHVNYFTPQSLRGLLRSCGFRVVHETSTFPM